MTFQINQSDRNLLNSRITLFVVAVLLTVTVQAATPIKRGAVLMAITDPAFGLLRMKDFSVTKIKGKTAYVAKTTKTSPYLVSVIGTRDVVDSIHFVGGLNKDNQLFVPLLLAAVASTAVPEHKDLGGWVLKNITMLAKQEGGQSKLATGSKTIELILMKPNIISMSIETN